MKEYSFISSMFLLSILFPLSFGQNQTSINNTESVGNNNSDVQLSKSNMLIASLIDLDSDAISFTNEHVYYLNDPKGVFARFNTYDFNKSQYYDVLSDPNRIDFSENSIRVNFSFKLPVSNTTTQIERVDATFPVTYIINNTDSLEYQGWSNYPISINGTEYQPIIFFHLIPNGQSYFTIENFTP